MGNKINPIKLRGHHLKAVRGIFKSPKEEIFEEWKNRNYINSENDLFVKVAYFQLREIFSNPDNLIELLDTKEDFICKACRFRKKDKEDWCLEQERNYISIIKNINQDFDLGIFKSRDREFIELFGLKTEKIYSEKS